MKKPTAPLPSRRDFLRLVSVGGAAIAGFPAILRGAEPKPLGVALLGLGRYSSGQLGPALKVTKNCKLVGVVTGHPEKAEKWQADYGLEKKNCYSYDNFD